MTTEAMAAMKLVPDPALRTGIFLLIVSSIVLMVLKPNFMYDEGGGYRSFGTRKNQTLFPFWLSITTVGFLGYTMTMVN